MSTNPLCIQIGGSHYKHFVIQPVEYIHQNHLSFLAGCIIERICRFNLPGVKGLEDLRKISHELDLLINQYNKGFPGHLQSEPMPLNIGPVTFSTENNLDDDQRTMITLITAYHHGNEITALHEAKILIIDIISAFTRTNWIAVSMAVQS
ncbi:MAG: hypothetical protein ACXWAT_02050 [Methylobacter sp.]